jgi:competence protein ComEC
MPLLGVSLAFLCGIALAAAAQGLPTWAWAAGGGLTLAWALLGRGHPRRALYLRGVRLPLSVLLLAACLGGLRWHTAQPRFDAGDLPFYNDSGPLELSAFVSADPDVRDHAVLLRVTVTAIRAAEDTEPRAVRGTALVRLAPGTDWRYGDRLTLWGEPQTAPENKDFSYRAYLAVRGIYTYLPYPSARRTGSGAGSPLLAGLYALRRAAYAQINAMLPQPEAGLLSGILLGMENDLAEPLESAFQATGTAHIIAISGFNMAILSALVIALFVRFFRLDLASLLAVIVIGLYTVLVGANPAVVRAALMAGLVLAARLIGRSSSGLTPLSFTAAGMCAANPRLLWDVSFQLSFTATLGLVLLAGPLQSGMEAWAARRISARAARALAGVAGEYVLFTLAAQVMTLPVVLVHFGRLSWSALLANVLILPVQPLVMELGGAALLAGALWPPLGAALAWPLSAYTIRMVEWLAQLPGGVSAVPLSAGLAWLYYGLLAAVMALRGRALPWRRWLRPAVLLTAFSLLTLALWSAALHRPDGRLHIVALEDEAAVWVESAAGTRLAAGAPVNASTFGDALGRETGPFDRRLSALIATGVSAKTLQTLPAIVERLPVGQVAWLSPLPQSASARAFEQKLAETGVSGAYLPDGTNLAADAQLSLTVLAQNGLRLDAPQGCAYWPGAAAPPADGTVSGCVLLLDTAQWQAYGADWLELAPPVVLVSGAVSGELPPNVYSTAVHGRLEWLSDGQHAWLLAGR